MFKKLQERIFFHLVWSFEWAGDNEVPSAEWISNNLKNTFHERLHNSQIGPFADDDQIIDSV